MTCILNFKPLMCLNPCIEHNKWTSIRLPVFPWLQWPNSFLALKCCLLHHHLQMVSTLTRTHPGIQNCIPDHYILTILFVSLQKTQWIDWTAAASWIKIKVMCEKKITCMCVYILHINVKHMYNHLCKYIFTALHITTGYKFLIFVFKYFTVNSVRPSDVAVFCPIGLHRDRWVVV